MAEYVSEYTGTQIDEGIRKALSGAADKLSTARTINGVEFDGTKNVTTKYSYNYTTGWSGSSKVKYRTIGYTSKNNAASSYSQTTMILSGNSEHNSSRSGVATYLLSITIDGTQMLANINQLIKNSDSNNIEFGTWEDDNFIYLGYSVVPWSLSSSLTVLFRDSNGDNVFSISFADNEQKPTNWTEIPIRQLLANGEVNASTDITNGVLSVEHGGTGSATGKVPKSEEAQNAQIAMNAILAQTAARAIQADTLSASPTINGTMFDGTENINTRYSYNYIIPKNENTVARYIDFAELSYENMVLGASLLFSFNTHDYSFYNGTWILSVSSYNNSAGNLFYTCTEITNSQGTSAPIFGFRKLANGHFILTLKATRYTYNIAVTVLNTKGSFAFVQSEYTTTEPSGFTEIPIRKLLGSEGGAVNGLIENYGGIGIGFAFSTTSNSYRNIAKVTNAAISNTSTASCIVSSPGNYGSAIGGVWIIEFGNRRGSFDCTINCIHPPKSGSVSFGKYSDENYFYLSVNISSYPNAMSVTPLNCSVTDNANAKIEFLPSNYTNTAPTGWTEIPQRVLQDEAQVRAIVQEELAKLNQ